MTPELDIVIPVYNEGRNIVATLGALSRSVTTPARVLICYDRPDDDTLPAIRDNPQAHAGLALELVRNAGRGAHGAIMTGFAASTAPYVLMYAADDDYNAPIVDRMVALARSGCDIVCASRFMPGGGMTGCPLLKALRGRTPLLSRARADRPDRTHEMAENTLAVHDHGVALDAHHRPRGRVLRRCAAADLSRRRSGRLRLDPRAHAGRKDSDRAAVSAGA